MPTADDFDTDEAAALEFEKLPDDAMLQQFTAGPWDQECANAGITLRLAVLMLKKTKPELIEAVCGLGPDGLFEFLQRLAAHQERFSLLAGLLKSLEARLVVAASAAMVEGRDWKLAGDGLEAMLAAADSTRH